MRIPPGVRSSILLSDVDLERELVALTDAHTDDLFSWLAVHGATRFVNRRSRLVVDPERLLDPAAEPTEAFGQGAVYTRTSDGRALRTPDPAAREALRVDDSVRLACTTQPQFRGLARAPGAS